MRHATKLFLLPLLVLAAALGLAACGGGGGDEEETVAGSFEALPGAGPEYTRVSGDASLTRADSGTTAEIELTGLEPSTAYVAHLDTGACTQPDAGGPHFQFEKGGSEEPPNEIHLELETDAKGNGSATATAKREVPAGEAGSIVLRLADAHAHSDKIACAELEGGGGSAAVPTIVVRDGEPVGGIKQLEYSAGEEIRFKVSGDEAEEIHVHGYDLMEDIPSGGGTVEFDFPAEIEGIFEGELEGQGVQILELTVNP